MVRTGYGSKFNAASLRAGKVAQNQILTSGLLSSCCDDWNFVPLLSANGKQQQCDLQRPDYPLINFLTPYPLSLAADKFDFKVNLGLYYFYPRLHTVSAGHLLNRDNKPLTLFGTGNPTRSDIMADMQALFYTNYGLERTFAAMMNEITDLSGGFDGPAELQTYMHSVCKTPGAEMEVFGRIVGRVMLHMQFKRKVIAFRLTYTGNLTLCLL